MRDKLQHGPCSVETADWHQRMADRNLSVGELSYELRIIIIVILIIVVITEILIRKCCVVDRLQ